MRFANSNAAVSISIANTEEAFEVNKTLELSVTELFIPSRLYTEATHS